MRRPRSCWKSGPTSQICSASADRGSQIKVLFVCTGNVCRSPFAAAMLAALSAAPGQPGDGRTAIEVSSAGLLPSGLLPPAEIHQVAEEAGLDLSQHVSTQLTAEAMNDADLVLCMAREHVREAVVLLPEAWPKTFTLKEFVRRATEADKADPEPQPRTLADWVGRFGGGRNYSDMLGEDSADDVADPIGGTERAYRAMARTLNELVERLKQVLAAAPPP